MGFLYRPNEVFRQGGNARSSLTSFWTQNYFAIPNRIPEPLISALASHTAMGLDSSFFKTRYQKEQK